VDLNLSSSSSSPSPIEVVRAYDQMPIESPTLDNRVFGPVCPQRKKLSASKAYIFPAVGFPSHTTPEPSTEMHDPPASSSSSSGSITSSQLQQQSSIESLPLSLLVCFSETIFHNQSFS
jgi:hypothetical protein